MAECMGCNAIATDPDKGPSRWARAVIANSQVLICPECQSADPTWIHRCTSCPVCGSKRVSKTLGEKVCRACGHSWGSADAEEWLRSAGTGAR